MQGPDEEDLHDEEDGYWEEAYRSREHRPSTGPRPLSESLPEILRLIRAGEPPLEHPTKPRGPEEAA